MTICEHIKDNGDTCGSPALKGEVFCYFHQRLRLPRHRPGDFEYKLPILDTPESILMAIQHITQAALDGVLEERRARLILSALRLALTTLKEMQKRDDLKKNEEKNLLDAARPRAAGSTPDARKTADLGMEPDNVDTGFQARVGVAQATPTGGPFTSPKKPPQSAPLSAHQLKLMKKIIRRGPSHPQFKLAARLLDHSISGAR